MCEAAPGISAGAGRCDAADDRAPPAALRKQFGVGVGPGWLRPDIRVSEDSYDTLIYKTLIGVL